MKIKHIKEAIIALATFKTYTDMPRWMEICYSVLFWFIVSTLFFTAIKILI